MANSISIRKRLKLILKEAQRSNSFEKALAPYGFSISYIAQYSPTQWRSKYSQYKNFVRFLAIQTPERRQAIFRLGRAALKKGTLVNIKFLFPCCYRTWGYEQPESDLREILFDADVEKARIQAEIKELVFEMKAKMKILVEKYHMKESSIVQIYKSLVD